MITRSLNGRLTEDLKAGKKIILLYGSRQVGKTTLINQVIRALDYKILAIDADATDQLDVLSSRNPEKIRLLIGDHDLLFIDEAQRIPDIGINLKIIHDQMPEKRVIVSGSSSLDLANRVIEPLTGRTWTYTLYPISLKEWQIHKGFSKIPAPSVLENLLLFGSYPEQLTINDRNRKIQYLHELRQAYLYKDVLVLGNIRYPEKLDQLLRLLAYQVGQLVSIQKLANTLQINRATVNNYLELLEKAFVIFRLSGFSRNLRKEITKMSKIYFYDLGVRNAIINNFSPIDLRNDTGALWENFLIAERKKYLAYSFNYANTYFWNTHTGAEVDYVEERNGQYHGFEFKWNPKKHKKTYQPWLSAYPNATYKCITPEQLGNWLLDE